MRIRTIKEDGSVKQATATKVAFAACASIVLAAASSLLAGCNSASASVDQGDYATTLNRYYEGRPACLWPESVTFPVQAVTPDQNDHSGFEALVDAGLLTRKRSAKNASQITYDLTKEGHSALDRDIDHPNTGNFCYGRRKVLGIEADRHVSPTTQQVAFRYQLTEPAAWAREESIQRAFPQVVAEISGPHKAEVDLLDTNFGWEVSGAPTLIAAPSAAPQHISTVAKVKPLFRNNKKQAS